MQILINLSYYNLQYEYNEPISDELFIFIHFNYFISFCLLQNHQSLIESGDVFNSHPSEGLCSAIQNKISFTVKCRKSL